ncbi:MAG: (2Fe-2S) ferredoxin domain-containing protein [Bacteroidetes bacterium]|nr:(2Fe-2S) ferredoxin domain-containing protein [Bacteroidota bacterium]MBK9672891.1 (2Fe-2S) ferredoxin domain-containing protein [Bacteroidota bacterium]MBK9801012.1 (2Fe-2S) ferredoxin domain-containing protein [Bacteroidota bacterium]MBP6414686.1 (2Fe-2S) ferredoxin domain-containing protein [Bacteroidia bacterium]
MIYDKHIFICTNERKNSPRLSCGEAHGSELIAAFKAGIAKRESKITIRTQKTGCLDICDFGPTLVVYPEGIFYVGVQLSDVDEIIDEHLMNNRPVERLILRSKPIKG